MTSKWDLILDHLDRISDRDNDLNKDSDSAEESMGDETHPEFAQRKAANSKKLKNIREIREKAEAMVKDFRYFKSIIRLEGETVYIGGLVVPKNQEEQNEEAKEEDEETRTHIPFRIYEIKNRVNDSTFKIKAIVYHCNT